MTKPVIPWMGGKGRISDWVISKFPVHECYVEAFTGGGAIFFAKPVADVEVINDINGELVNMYRIIKNHPEEFIRQFKWALSSRQMYKWEQLKVPETLTDIQRAARFYYLQKLAFGGKVEGQSFGSATTTKPRLNLFRLEEDLSMAHLRLQSTYIEHLSWEKVIAKYDRPHALFYLDPPYLHTAGYGMDFGVEQYELMAKLAGEIEGSMVISLNDIPETRAIFDGLHMDSTPIKYTVGGGAGTDARELLIWNDKCHESERLLNTSTMALF